MASKIQNWAEYFIGSGIILGSRKASRKIMPRVRNTMFHYAALPEIFDAYSFSILMHAFTVHFFKEVVKI
jgi:hypothetical protein